MLASQVAAQSYLREEPGREKLKRALISIREQWYR